MGKRQKHKRTNQSQTLRLMERESQQPIGIEIPKGDSREDIKARKQIISDFYAKWMAKNPDKRVWNQSLNDYIYVKFHSINETKGHASGTYESTKVLFELSKILERAALEEEKPQKKGDNNQKIFSKMLIMRYKHIKLTVGYQPSKGQYVQYCITVPGTRMHKK